MRSLPWFALCAVVASLNGCDSSATWFHSSTGGSAAGAAPPSPTAVGPPPGPEAAVRAAPNPYADDSAAIRDGRQLFVRMNCSGCHGGRAGGGMGPSLRDVVWIYGNRDDQIFDSIAEGRAKGMPAWGTRLPSDQIWKLVAYIKSMRTDREPDKPADFP